MSTPLQSQANLPVFANTTELSAYAPDGLLVGFIAGTMSPLSFWIFSPSAPTSNVGYVTGFRGYWIRYSDIAADVPYNDTLSPPTIGQTNVQGAIDAIKGGAGSDVTAVIGDAPITSTGGATPHVGINPASASTSGSMSITDFNKLAGLPTSAVTAVTATGPIQSSGGTAPVISINASSASTSGSMSISDFSKLAGLPSSAVPTTTQVIAGTNLTGGGTLSGNVTLNVSAAPTGFTSVSYGSTPANAGTDRHTNNDSIRWNDGGSNNYVFVQMASNNYYIGCDTGLANMVAVGRVYASSQIILGTGGSNHQSFDSGRIRFSVPTVFNDGSAPGTPTSSCSQWSASGSFKNIGSSGTTTTLAPA